MDNDSTLPFTSTNNQHQDVLSTELEQWKKRYEELLEENQSLKNNLENKTSFDINRDKLGDFVQFSEKLLKSLMFAHHLQIELQKKQEELENFISRFEIVNTVLLEGLWETQIPPDLVLKEDTPIWFSHRFAQMLGYTPEEFPHRISTWSEKLHPSHREKVFQIYADFIQGKLPNDVYDIEYMLKCKSGEYKWFSARAKLIRDELGNPIRESGSLSDIHERKRSEANILETETRIQLMLQSVKQGYFTWNRLTGETFYSPEYYSILGYEDQEFVPSYQWYENNLHPADSEKTLFHRNQFLEGLVEDYDVENRLRTKSGEYKWFLTKGYMIERDVSGKWLKLLGIVTEIDKHKKNEAHIKELESHFQKALDLSKQGLWTWHLPTNTHYHTPSYLRLMGYESDVDIPELSFEFWQDSLHPNDKERIIALECECIEGHLDFYEAEYLMKVRNGEYKWVSAFSQVMEKDEQGKATRMMGLIMDISTRKKNERIIQESEARLSIAINTSKMGLWDWFPHEGEKFYYCDFFKLLGYPQDFVPTVSDWQASIHPDDGERIITSMQSCVLGLQNRIEGEYRMKTYSGEYHWFYGTAKVLDHNKKGMATRLLGTILDIQERKLAEQVLYESEEKFRLLVENHSAAIAIYSIDKFFYVNPEFLRMFEYTAQEIENLSLLDIIHPDNYTKITERTQKRPEKIGIYNRYELIGLSKSGNTMWIDLNAIPIKYKGESVNIATMYDITDRKKYEIELKEAYEEIRASEEEIRQNAEELSAINDSLEEAKSQLENLLEKEKIVNEKMERKNYTLYIQKKQIKKTLDELKEAQEHLIQSEKLASLGVLVAGVAHEINNPVNYISSSTLGLKTNLEDIWEVLKSYETLNPDNIKEKLKDIKQLKSSLDYDFLIEDTKVLLENIESGANQTAEIVRGLRTFSRLEGRDFEKVDIHQVIDTSLLLLHNEYKYSVEVIKEFGIVNYVEALQGKLNQVFINLISNAIDAVKTKLSHEKARIIIRTYMTEKKNKSFVVIEVEDNGNGIPPEIKNRIFEPFFTTKEVGKGTGLGLSISLGIIESFNGKIEVISELNQGTKFIVYLPAITDEI
jgi:PAS domain S-box-containing protein